MQIRPLYEYYTRVNTPLEGEKYLREYFNSLPGHVRLLMCSKGNVTNIVKTNWRANDVENTT